MENLHDVDWSTIPAPIDEGDAGHLTHCEVPCVLLPATSGEEINLAALDGLNVVYAYPMTGRPDIPLPDGWNMLPGARGCTPQSCAFRDHSDELKKLGVNRIFGLSTQETDYQREAVARLHLEALNLPVITVNKMTLLKRLTMIIIDGRISQVFYPVFPPNESAAQVIDWLKAKH